MKKKRVFKKIAACLAAAAVCFGTLAYPAIPENGGVAEAAGLPKGVASKIAAYGNHALSQVIDGIAESISESTDSKAPKEVGAFINKWVLGQGTSISLQNITSLCNDILGKVNEIAANQVAYGNAILSTINNSVNSDCIGALSAQIDTDISRFISTENIDFRQVMEKYQNYLQAASDYTAGKTTDTSAMDAAEKAYVAALCALYGFNGAISNEDAIRTVMTSYTVNGKLITCINGMTGALDPVTPGSLTVADCAAALAYRYYPWSQDQYQFICYEIDSQLQQIMILEMIYQDLIGRQYDYNVKNGYFENGYTDANGNVTEAAAYVDTYNNNVGFLVDTNTSFGERFAALLDRDLQAAPGISLKLRQYYKPTDRDMDRDPYFHDSAFMYGENTNFSFNVEDEEDDYLYSDFHNGGPMLADGEVTETDVDTKVSYLLKEADGTSAWHNGEPYLPSEFYPVTRNGGVNLYYISYPYYLKNPHYDDIWVSIRSMYEEVDVSKAWAWGQNVPSANFFNLTHGVWYEDTAYHAEGIKNKYKVAANSGEAQPLFNSPAFSSASDTIPLKYLGVESNFQNDGDYLLYTSYRMTANHWGHDGNPFFNVTRLNDKQNAGTLSMYEFDPDTGSGQSHYYVTYAAMIPESADTYAAVYFNSAGGGSISSVEAENPATLGTGSNSYKAGESLTMHLNPEPGKVPGAVTVTDLKTNVTKTLVDEGAASLIPANEDGTYDIDVIVPYFGGNVTVNFIDDPDLSGQEGVSSSVHPKNKTFTVTSRLGTFNYKITGKDRVRLLSVTDTKAGTTVVVPDTVTADGKTYRVTAMGTGCFKNAKCKSVIIGKNMTYIGKKAFSGAKDLTTLVMRSMKLYAPYAKNSLTGSSVTTIKVNVGTAAQNQRFVKHYKTVFRKANSGKKVDVI